MCVVSMIIEDRLDKWQPDWEPKWKYNFSTPEDWTKQLIELRQKLQPLPPPPSKEEIEEFRRLLDRARQYDREHNQPNCEMESKRQRLKEIAELWGIDISFIDEKDGTKDA